MSDLAGRLTAGPCLLLDGGLGSMLLAGGLTPGDAPERLNLNQPDLVLDVHRRYVAAGSQAIHSNTFGANPFRLAHFGLDDQCAELNRRAVEIARQAEPAFLLGDMGPTGQYLPPVGDGDCDRWREGFLVQATALLAAGVDGIHIETMGDRREAETALAAIRSLDANIPVLVSLTFDRKKRGFFTVMGDPLIASLNTLLAAGATAVGANCSIVSGDMGHLAAAALAEVTGPLVFQPNAGQPGERDGVLAYAQDPRDYAADLKPVIAGGAAAVGGCCGTDPRFIALLAEILARPGPGSGSQVAT